MTFWIGDYMLAHRFCYVVEAGLFIGNFVKDVFQLPRPSSARVWRPCAKTDSTHFQDFGFPSTHSMNAVTNSLAVLLFVYGGEGGADHFVPLPAAILLAAAYCVSLVFSRLYLGAHTPTDIRGGILLGLLFMSLYWPMRFTVDRLVAGTDFLELKLLLGLAFVLYMSPRPNPPTPTFLQNALIAGLLAGQALGTRNYFFLPGPSLDGALYFDMGSVLRAAVPAITPRS
jgi:hypothetical protein